MLGNQSIDLRFVQKPLKRRGRYYAMLREPVYRPPCRSETTEMQEVDIMPCSGNQSIDFFPCRLQITEMQGEYIIPFLSVLYSR